MSYTLGKSYTKNLKEIGKSFALNQSANIDEYIAGMKLVMDSMHGQSKTFNEGMMAGTQMVKYFGKKAIAVSLKGKPQPTILTN